MSLFYFIFDCQDTAIQFVLVEHGGIIFQFGFSALLAETVSRQKQNRNYVNNEAEHLVFQPQSVQQSETGNHPFGIILVTNQTNRKTNKKKKKDVQRYFSFFQWLSGKQQYNSHLSSKTFHGKYCYNHSNTMSKKQVPPFILFPLFFFFHSQKTIMEHFEIKSTQRASITEQKQKLFELYSVICLPK